MNALQSTEEYLEWDPIDIFISHKPPSRYPRFPYHGLVSIEHRPSIVIGRSMVEVDWVSPEDVARLRSSEWIDEIWAPSRFVKIVYVQHGVHPNRIRVIPIPINVAIYNEVQRLSNCGHVTCWLFIFSLFLTGQCLKILSYLRSSEIFGYFS